MSAFSEMLAVPVPSEAETVQQMDYVTYHLSLLPSAASTHDDDDNDDDDDATASSSSSRRSSSSNSSSNSSRSSSSSIFENCITLRESRWLYASAGATGYRTWEAGLHLGQYLCSAPDVVRGKRVLELGTGTGYVSVLCAKYLGAAKVTASDGAEGVLRGLADTKSLNGLQGSAAFVPTQVVWGDSSLAGATTITEEEEEEGAEWSGGCEEVDVVLGSDVTYDTRAIPALIATLGELFALFPRVRVLLCTAERNVATLNALLGQCEGAGMAVRWVGFPTPGREEQRGPFYDTSVPIHIVEIRREVGS